MQNIISMESPEQVAQSFLPHINNMTEWLMKNSQDLQSNSYHTILHNPKKIKEIESS